MSINCISRYNVSYVYKKNLEKYFIVMKLLDLIGYFDNIFIIINKIKKCIDCIS